MGEDMKLGWGWEGWIWNEWGMNMTKIHCVKFSKKLVKCSEKIT